jgi:shikimate kinase
MTRRHLLLVGLSGSGKSTAGRLAAERLGAPFVDIDQRIAGEHSLTITELFARHGEPWFRDRERELVAAVLAGPPAVVATGGGWAAAPGNLELARGKALTVYLVVSPAVAARRLDRADDRPLLAGGERLGALSRLLAAREAAYGAADERVETDQMGVEAVAERIAELARLRGGW